MVKQYPHTVIVYQAPDASQNSQGDWDIYGSQIAIEKEGRHEPVSGSKGDATVKGQDGTQVRISGIVYMPLSYEPITVGAKVKVLNDRGEELINDTVKQFYRGQLNMRIWV